MLSLQVSYSSRTRDVENSLSQQTLDVPLILEFINELAIYEKEPDAVLATVETLTDTLGLREGSKAYAKTFLIFEGEKPAGMAL
jgi:hypothetical protein